MKSLNSKLLTAAVAACLVLPTMSMAGEYCPHNMGGGMGYGMMGGGRMMNHEALHKSLKLTADQETAWKTFSETMMPGKPMMSDKMDWNKLTTPERADKMLEFSKQHEQNMAEHVAAMKTFYAVLTPAQQKIFDDFHADRMPGMKNRPDKKDMPMQDKPMAK
jgi:Spy/CpxP family protein refolding chaperone